MLIIFNTQVQVIKHYIIRGSLQSEIRLLEHTFKFSLVDNTRGFDQPLGYASLAEGDIKVLGKMPKDTTASTTLHEVVHMIQSINSLEMSEQTVDALALGMLSFIRNNQKLIKETLL